MLDLTDAREQEKEMELTLQQQITLLLEEFDVPDMRRDVKKKTNVRWLMRNISANNSDHPQISHMKQCLKTLLSIKPRNTNDECMQFVERWE